MPIFRNIIVPIALALLIIGGGISVVTNYKIGKSVYESPQAKLVTETDRVATTDTDQDGLMDWEEELWRTDPAQSDSDKDGTADGEEVRSGRNPIVKGPNDKLDAETIEKKINKDSEATLTETDKFSRALFTKYIAAKQGGGTINPADYESFAHDVLLKQSATAPSREYRASDLTIFKVETDDIIRDYGNGLAELLTRKPRQPLEYELTILYRAEANNNPQELEKLKDNVAEYGRIRDDLLKLSVPQSAVPFHLTLLNSAAEMMRSIEGIRLIASDPVRALASVSKYPESSQAFIKAIVDFKSYFSLEKVSFAPSEYGYKLWTAI